MLLARWMLPKRSGKDGGDEYLRLDRYRTELLVVKDSRWNTRPLGELQKALGDRFRLIAWLRDDKMRGDLGKDNPLLSGDRTEEHTPELQPLMRISYADYC